MPRPPTYRERYAAMLASPQQGELRPAEPSLRETLIEGPARQLPFANREQIASNLGEAFSMAPITGDIDALDEMKRDIEAQNYVGAGVGATVNAIPFMPKAVKRKAKAAITKAIKAAPEAVGKGIKYLTEDPMGALREAGGAIEEGAQALIRPGTKTAAKQAGVLDRPTYSLGKRGDEVLAARAAQSDLPEAARVKPEGPTFFGDTPEAYQDPKYMPAQEATYVPRGGPGQPLPAKGRTQILVNEREKVAQALAERARPYLGTEAQFFYNTGPIRKKAMELGYSREEIDDWLNEFGKAYAATSPRTQTEQNLRNATLSMAKHKHGTPMTEPVVPYVDPETGQPFTSDKGYQMMLGPAAEGRSQGIHRGLLSDVYNPGIGLDPNTNPKPFTFAQNTIGNLQGATVDTHAIRGVWDVMNQMQPGSIPDTLIKTEFRKAYKADPTKFDPATWLKDKLESVKVGPKGRTVKMQTEYGPYADIYKRMGEILGVSPAEAQSMGWFGSGSRTGLGSEVKSIPTLLSDRIKVTSKLLGLPEEDVFRMLLHREIPLAQREGGSPPGVA